MVVGGHLQAMARAGVVKGREADNLSQLLAPTSTRYNTCTRRSTPLVIRVLDVTHVGKSCAEAGSSPAGRVCWSLVGACGAIRCAVRGQTHPWCIALGSLSFRRQKKQAVSSRSSTSSRGAPGMHAGDGSGGEAPDPTRGPAAPPLVAPVVHAGATAAFAPPTAVHPPATPPTFTAPTVLPPAMPPPVAPMMQASASSTASSTAATAPPTLAAPPPATAPPPAMLAASCREARSIDRRVAPTWLGLGLGLSGSG